MNIWLPNTIDYAAYKVDRAVNEYDERLMFGRNEDTGDWCVFIRLPGDRPPYPVMGFQHVPEAHEVIGRLQEGDTRKHSERIYREMLDADKRRRAELEYASDQAAADAAERTEHMMRKRGASPIIKVFVNGKGGDEA